MKKLNYLLLLSVFAFSCSSDDEAPEAIPEPVPFTVGLDNQENVDYYNGKSVSLTVDLPANVSANAIEVSKALDLDEDGTNDIAFKLITRTDSDSQTLEVKAINGTLLARQHQRFELDNNMLAYAQLAASGTTLERDNFNWTSTDPLFMMYRNNNEGISAAPSFVNQSSFLPVILKGQLGWVELQVSTDEPALDITGMDIKQVALAQPE